MKKIVLFFALAVLTLAAQAQLPYDTQFTQNHFNDPQTVISKSENSQWSGTGRIQLGPASIIESIIGSILPPEENEVVIALPAMGLPDKIYFNRANAGTGTMSILESTDHSNWTGVWSKEVEGSIGIAKTPDSAQLKSSTRYIKLHFNGTKTCSFGDFSVSELKSLSVGSDEIYFTDAMVDDAFQIKTVNVTWTNIIAAVSSSDSHFTVSANSVGGKNKENQTTSLAITYSHNEAGEHNGQIIIEGEGCKAVIAVHGKTSKFNQTLAWEESLGEYPTGANITLHAFSSQGLPVQYVSSDSSIAYVDEYAHVVPVCAGTITITATQPGNYKYNAAEPISKQMTFLRMNPTIAVSAAGLIYGQKVKESVLTETNGLVPGTLTWIDLDPEATLNAGSYTAQVLFTPNDNCMYNTITRNVLLVIDKADQVISWEQPVTELNEGEYTSLNAFASSELPLSYAMTNCIVDIDGNTLSALEEGETTIIAFQPGNENYNPSAVAMQTFTVHASVAPVTTRTKTVTLDELEQKGMKYIHHGVMYYNYQGTTYDANGKIIH
ncbi:MAG: hypothetical protein MJZ75_02115 [Paludibacteraceae bacterium]|nr:hypothetical protein [Paludibacteraceae bacterium]